MEAREKTLWAVANQAQQARALSEADGISSSPDLQRSVEASYEKLRSLVRDLMAAFVEEHSELLDMDVDEFSEYFAEYLTE